MPLWHTENICRPSCFYRFFFHISAWTANSPHSNLIKKLILQNHWQKSGVLDLHNVKEGERAREREWEKDERKNGMLKMGKVAVAVKCLQIELNENL